MRRYITVQMELNSSVRNHILNIFRRERGWLSAPFIATILHSDLDCSTPLTEDVAQLETFLNELPEVEESGGKYRLKVVEQKVG